MVIEAGANGGLNNTFVSFAALNALNPQPEVYLTFIESPAADAAFELYLMTIILLFNVPESNTPVEPNKP